MKPLIKIDPASRQHYYLNGSDHCYALGDYTSREGWRYSPMNQLIWNLKIQPVRGNSVRLKHKDTAIDTISTLLLDALGAKTFGLCTFFPMPPSMAQWDPAHDERLSRLLRRIAVTTRVEARELLLQRRSRRPFHRGRRISPERLTTHYVIDEALASPTPNHLVVLDDVLTSGCHFKAAKSVLCQRFPGVPIRGLFIARRVFSGASQAHQSTVGARSGAQKTRRECK